MVAVMALKFLNKKGWHTGSLRNIENVWKAEQKHEAEQRKLEELRKQIQDEREKSEFRQLQEQAGLVPRQERLDFLYESGLVVGKGSSDGFKALQAPPLAASTTSAAEASSSEDKPQSANDARRKLHSDPLLLIRQREQEAFARKKNNPINTAMTKKSVEAEKKKQDKEKREKIRHMDHHDGKSKHEKWSSRHHSDLEDTSDQEKRRAKYLCKKGSQRVANIHQEIIQTLKMLMNVQKGKERVIAQHLNITGTEIPIMRSILLRFLQIQEGQVSTRKRVRNIIQYQSIRTITS